MRDVNYIAELYGQVTDADDPEHAFSVLGVEWWNVEGHYVRFGVVRVGRIGPTPVVSSRFAEEEGSAPAPRGRQSLSFRLLRQAI